MVALMERPHAHGLPENHEYVDDGCELHPHCLTCPLPECVWDVYHGKQGLRVAAIFTEIVEMRKAGKPIREIAEAVGVSPRAVLRNLAKARREGKI